MKQLSSAGHSQDALSRCEQLQRENSDVQVWLRCHINILLDAIQTETSQSDEFTSRLEEIARLFNRVIEINPYSAEILIAYSQFQSKYLHNISDALVTAKQALSYVRSRDQMSQIFQLIILNEARLEAIQKITEHV
jgi:hypothetical protein